MKKIIIFRQFGSSPGVEQNIKQKYEGSKFEIITGFSFSPSKVINSFKKIRQKHDALFFLLLPPINIFKKIMLIPLLLLSPAKEKILYEGDVNVPTNAKFFAVTILLFLPALILNFFIFLFYLLYLGVFSVLLRKPPQVRQDKPGELGSVACLYPQFYLIFERIGGHVAHVKGVIKELKGFGYDPFVISAGDIEGVDVNYQIFSPVLRNYMTLHIARMFYGIYLVFKALPVIKRKKPAFVYQRHEQFNMTGVVLSFFTGIPVIIEANAILAEEARKSGQGHGMLKLLYLSEMVTFRAAHRILAISSSLKRDMATAGLDVSKIFVAPNGVDVEIFHPGCGGDKIRKKYGLENKVIAGFCGTFAVWHGLETLEVMAHEVLSQCENAACLFIGDGPGKEGMENKLRQKAYGDRAVFTGRIPHSEVPAHLDACDVLVSAIGGAYSYASPTKLFEYMAMKKPVVCYNMGQMPDIFEDNKTGRLVENNNKEAFASAVIELINNPEVRVKIGENARAEAERNYTWKANVRKILDNYRDIFNCK